MENKDVLVTEGRELTVSCVSQSIMTDCGEEFTLPDYYPEIKRVVTTLCRALPESFYNSGDAIEQGGIVAFTVLYLGDDGSLTAAPLTCDYTVAMQLPESEDRGDSVISVDTTVENVSCRCAGPRRLTLRARLRTAVSGDGKIPAVVKLTDSVGDEATTAEKLSVQIFELETKAMRRSSGKLTGSVSGELRESAGTKPVMCDGEIMVNEAVLSDGAVILRGEAVMWCICFGADGLYYKATTRAPFEERISLEGEGLKDGSARGFGRCASVSVKEQEDGVLLWDMEYDLECEAAENVTVKVAKDMYSTMYEGNIGTSECDSLSVLRCSNGRLSVSGAVSRGSSTATGDYIIGSFGKAVCDKLERTGARLILTGTAEVRVLVCGGGDVTEENVRLPFRYECDCPDGGEGELFRRCDVTVADSTARLDGNTLHVTAELCVSLFAGLSCPLSYASKLELDRAAKICKREGILRIYYPSEGESAWDITKRYHINKNAVTEVTADGVLIE